MILQEFIEITITSKNLQYYKNIGYKVENKQKIFVKNKDLPDGSKVLEKRKCDCCGKVFERTHRAIISTFAAYEKDACVECSYKLRTEKAQQTFINKYGVQFPMQSKEFQKKAVETTLKKYGVEYTFQDKDFREAAIESFKKKHNGKAPLQVKEIKNKVELTNLARYGSKNVFSNSEVKKKIQQTIKEKYGVDNVSQNKDIMQKKEYTCLQKYQVKHPLQNKEIHEKMMSTFLKNGHAKTSIPQQNLFRMCQDIFHDYKVEENIQVSSLVLDIRIITEENVYIDVEYDGWYWHKDKKRDRARDEILKNMGYKIIRVKSGEKLPSESQLIEAIDYLINENKSFSQIILDDWKEN